MCVHACMCMTRFAKPVPTGQELKSSLQCNIKATLQHFLDTTSIWLLMAKSAYNFC